MKHRHRPIRGAIRPWWAWPLAALLLAVAARSASAQNLQPTVEALVQSHDFGKTVAAVAFMNVADRDLLAQFNGEQQMIPASNMKLVITAAALGVLGDKFVFRTRLLQDKRTLIVRGDGDPAFADPKLLERMGLNFETFLDGWVTAVERTGLKQFDVLLIDDRVFDRQFVHRKWPTDQLHRWYAAQVAGINVNDNCVDIYASPSRPGSAPALWTVPADAPVAMTNLAKTSTKKSQFGASRHMGGNRIRVYGHVPMKLAGARLTEVTIHDPPMFFGGVLQRRLARAGIRIDEVRRIADDAPVRNDAKLLAVVESPLPVVLARCNKDSQSLFAEALLKRIGRQATGRPGSWVHGSAAVRVFLSRHLGPDAAAVIIDDGSGLSRENRVTTRLMVELLSHMATDPALGTIYKESMAIGGQDGTLRKRFRNAGLHGTVLGKSGWIKGVVALSGYLVYDDRTIAYSIILNHPENRLSLRKGKRFIDQLIAEVDKRIATADAVQVGG